MAEEVYIKSTVGSQNLCQIVAGNITSQVIAKQRLSIDGSTTLENESIKILCDCVSANCSNIEDKSNTILAFGYVQSGKTLSFETVTALAKDNGYKLVIIIAGRTNILLNQTTKRLKDDLEIKASSGNFKIFKNLTKNDISQINNALINPRKPTLIITVLKHQKYLNELSAIFLSQKLKNEFSKKGVIIIDDESDQASLNTYAKANAKSEDPEEFSAIYEGIKNLRNTFPNHTYIQYTATPQANLLIDYFNLLSPDSIHVLTPGLGYTGGKDFFKLNNSETTYNLINEHQVSFYDGSLGTFPLYVREIPRGECYHPLKNDLVAPPPSLKESLRQFLIGATITVMIDKTEEFVSMLIHPTNIIKSHKKFKTFANTLLEQWSKEYLEIKQGGVETNSFYEKMQESYSDYLKTTQTNIEFKELWNEMFEIITSYKIHLVTGDEVDLTDDAWEEHLAHILIGGNKLDRGFTVKNLICTYMPRYSIGKSNADTIQQRCRFFGYKQPFLKSCRVFLPADSINEYADYVEDEETLRDYFKKYQLKDFFEGRHMMGLTPRLNATRTNVISSKIISNQLSGYKFFQPFGYINDNNTLVKSYISSFEVVGEIEYSATKHDVYKVPLEDVLKNLIEKFKFIYPDDDIKVKNLAMFLETAKFHGKNDAYILHMAKGEARERGIREHVILDSDKNNSIVYRINQFHQGSNNNYPGDKYLLTSKCKYDRHFGYNDDFIIQLYNFKPKGVSFDKNFYTIALYYPESITAHYIALQ